MRPSLINQLTCVYVCTYTCIRAYTCIYMIHVYIRVYTYAHDHQQSKSNAECALCGKLLRALNSDARQRTAVGTFGHIQSAGCLGTREAVIAAHNKCVNGLVADICKHQVKRCALRFISNDKDKSLKSLWKDWALQNICSREELWAAAADRERRSCTERRGQGGNALSERK